MPRKGAKKHWKLKMSPDEWYSKPDPWNVRDDIDERKKANWIFNNINKGEIGLDVGCGEGHFTNLYKQKFNIMMGCDISLKAIERAIGKYHSCVFFQWDMSKPIINLKEKVDTVICSEVLYYIDPKYLKLVSDNIIKLLKPHGKLVVSVSRYFTLQDINELFPDVFFHNVLSYDFKGDDCIIAIGEKRV